MRGTSSNISIGLNILLGRGGGSVLLSSLSLHQRPPQLCTSSALVASDRSFKQVIGNNNIWCKTTTTTTLSSFSFSLINSSFGWLSNLRDMIWNIKRTYQPSVVKRRRKHGLMARLTDRNGRKVLQRRLRKKRSRVVTCL